jgi:hypothetical protein
VRRHAKAPTARRRHLPRALACAFVLSLIAMAVASAPASAALSRNLLETRTGVAGASPGPLTTDAAGNLYVQDYGNGQGIEKFDPAGNPLDFSASQSYITANRLTGPASGTFFDNDPYHFGLYHGLAIDESGGPTNGYIYAMAAFANGGGANVFDSTGTYKGFIKYGAGVVGEVNYACSLAVDQSSSDVLLSASYAGIFKRVAPVDGDPANDTVTGKLNVGEGTCATAVDSTGSIYLASGTGVTKYPASVFDNPVAGTTIDPNQATALAVNPANDHVAVDTGERVIEYDAAGTKVAEVGGLNSSEGVAYGTGGKLYVSQTDGPVLVYGPPIQLPIVTTLPVSELFPDAATLEGEVDPDSSGPVTKCEFRYGLDRTYASGSLPCSPSTPITSPTQVRSPHLENLPRETTYHYRLIVQGANGTQPGADLTFTTPPPVEGIATGEATEVTKETATLNGSFIGRGEDHRYYFEYGTDTNYGQNAPAPPGNDAGSAKGQQDVAPVAISDLQGGTEYHYRLVMTNAFGESHGEDRTFTTPPAVTNLTTEAPTGITNHSAELHGSFDGDKYDVHYYFEYGPNEGYGQTAPVPPGNDAGVGGGHVEVAPVAITGLQAGATYHYRVVASNERGKTFGGDQVFKTSEAPTVSSLSTRAVQANSAELTASINPGNGDTSYHFEYGATTAYGTSVPVPDEDIGGGRTDVSVAAQIAELTPGITYHFRVVAQNQYGQVVSVDQTFGFYPPSCPNSRLRQETGSNTLPDCRAYELASPSYTGGALIYPAGGPSSGYATNPARVAFAGNFGFIPGAGEAVNGGGDLYVATRTDSGWRTKYIGLAGNETEEMGGPPEGFRGNFFEHGAVEGQVGVQATPSLDRILSYDDNPKGFFGSEGKTGPSNAPYVWSASTNEKLARFPTGVTSVEHGIDFKGTPIASADFTHFVFSSDVPFVAGVESTPIPEYARPCCSEPIYDNNTITGEISHISVREDGSNFSGIPLNVSADGTRILMAEGLAAKAEEEAALYISVDDGNGRAVYDIANGHPVRYAGSTNDGRTVYIASSEQLTADDHDSSTDLFMWRESEPHALTRISSSPGEGTGNSDDCTSSWTAKCGIQVISFKAYATLQAGRGGNGVSDSAVAAGNGDIYFESPEQLDGDKGEAGQVNLYDYRDGKVQFVITLSPTPLCTEGAGGPVCSAGPIARMQVTPDDGYAAFVTASKATSYDNAGHGEMYIYRPSTGRLVCASCLPSGAPPTHDVLASQNGLFLTNDGRVAFSTVDALVPQDTDEFVGTYEYTEGKPYLISSALTVALGYFAGVTEGQITSGLVGISANGVDLYFASTDHLVTQDHNGQEVKIYDARTNGGFAAEVTPPNCQAADECHGSGSSSPAPPADRTSASLGAGYHKHAKKKHRKHRKKAKHRKQAKRRYAAAKDRRGL